MALNRVAGKQGFEPRFHDPESCVLPLDDFPAIEIHHNKFYFNFQACIDIEQPSNQPGLFPSSGLIDTPYV